jgi:hypothetical protein
MQGLRGLIHCFISEMDLIRRESFSVKRSEFWNIILIHPSDPVPPGLFLGHPHAGASVRNHAEAAEG